MKKILYCASTSSHILNFHLPYIQFFKTEGWQVDIGIPDYVSIPNADNILLIPLEKKNISVRNIKAINFVTEYLVKMQYDIISTHTALAGSVVRIAASMSNNIKAKIVHTSHGYFFNEAKSLREWPYLFVERLVSPVTDKLMVMNTDDYHIALEYRLGKEVFLIPGMGVDLDKFTPVSANEKKRLRENYGFDSNDFLIIYAAEMSKRKNQGELIRAFSQIAIQMPNMKLLLAGEGLLKNDYISLAGGYGLEKQIYFPGHITNMSDYYRMCDVVISTSKIEGLPFNIMEAMACKLPILASNIKGHSDLLRGHKYDCLYPLGNEKILMDKILTLCKQENLRSEIGLRNLEVIQNYNIKRVKPMITDIYKSYL